MKLVYKICPLCGKEIRANSLSRHLHSHELHPDGLPETKYSLNHDGLICQFCGRECKNRNSLCNHERLCKQNPNKQYIDHPNGKNPNYRNGMTGKASWNKGLTAESDERVKLQTQRMRAALQSLIDSGKFTSTGRGSTEEIENQRRQKLREVALRNGLGGMNRNKNSITYNGVKLNSTYELKVAQDLDSNNIKWEKPKRFNYIDNEGKLHTYTADFYLPEYDVYLDPKNDFLIENINPALGFSDLQKIQWVMEQNNITVIVLNKDELKWESIKIKLNISA